MCVGDSETWFLHFDYNRPAGETPRPTRFRALNPRSGQRFDLPIGRPVDPPFSYTGATVVVWDAVGAVGCLRALRWPNPAKLIDLRAEYLFRRSGDEFADNREKDDFGAALAHHHIAAGGVDGLRHLLEKVPPGEGALERGRYGMALAAVEAAGTPIDVETYELLRERFDSVVRPALVDMAHRRYGAVYTLAGTLQRQVLFDWCKANGVFWPRKDGELNWDLGAIRAAAHFHPDLVALYQIESTLRRFGTFELAVGADGRNRVPQRPWSTTTGRNAPSSKRWIWGLPRWARCLIRPPEGMSLLYLDWRQQECGIGAALSKDAALGRDYHADDLFLAFGRRVALVPADATKDSHPVARERLKQVFHAISYGKTAFTLARDLKCSMAEAKRYIDAHRAAYPRFHAFLADAAARARADGEMRSHGWRRTVTDATKRRSLLNWPLQAVGADLLRSAIVRLDEYDWPADAFARVLAPVHDGLVLEVPSGREDEVRAIAERLLGDVSADHLNGFRLRTSCTPTGPGQRYGADEKSVSVFHELVGMVGTNPLPLGPLDVFSVCGSRGPSQTLVLSGSAHIPRDMAERKAEGLYVYLRFSIPWLKPALKFRGHTVLSAIIATLVEAGYRQRRKYLRVANPNVKKFGLKKEAKLDGLSEAEHLRMVKIKKSRRGAPRVTIPHVKKGPHFKCRIPLHWLAKVMAYKSRPLLATALAVWYIRSDAGRDDRLELTGNDYELFCVTPKAGRANLRWLAEMGLVRLDGKSIVTILRDGAASAAA
jgi:hypothetical protein